MNEQKWILKVFAISILAGIPLVNPDRVRSEPSGGTSSDNTGTNTFSAPPNFDSGGGGTAGATFTQTSNEASSLSQELNQAIDNVAASETAPKSPRHFTRKGTKECINPAVEELNNTVKKSQNFLKNANTSQTNRGNSSAW
jgi:hypothetical protein